MDLSFIDTLLNELDQICNFLFETYTGIGILVLATLLLTFVIAAILEIKTKNKYKNHPVEEDIDKVEEED